MKVQLISGKHYRMEDGEQVRHVAGDVFDVPESEYQALKDKLQPVDEPAQVKINNHLHEVHEAVSVFKQIMANHFPGQEPTIEIQVKAQEDERPDQAEPGEQLVYIPTDEPISFAVLFGEKIADALHAAGIDTLDKLAPLASDPEKLAAVKGIGKTKAGKIREELIAMNIPVEPAKGGYVEPNTVYLVGEGDSDLFVPKEP